jgi:hypothetical protein
LHPENGLQEQVLVLHTASQVQTVSQVQLVTGTQVQTEWQEQVPLDGAVSSGCMMCTSLSGIFMSTVLNIFGCSPGLPFF